ncbi:RimJ/RimL family protein N-acetyltransferase [Deinobacterium chartae]|uniref:RimJ/RimL family protein N-acetyltransferase n=1 Tax=Deinobacterium chartae TaxID=521158 RepID=A0A841HTB7_9DEIO|nr:RimJ/RimL family protein N-acetyltransferase [Deinobacterium chartae]
MTLRSLDLLSPSDWKRFYSYFRDREIADWNGAKPIRVPLWLFKRMMLDEESSGERYGFGIYVEDRFIGSVELYDLYPYPPDPPVRATLGIMIGERSEWSRGYGREAVRAALGFAFERLEPPLERVRLTTFLHNRRAQRAFEAAGLRRVGLRERGDVTDVLMEATRSDWLNPPQP